MGTALGEGVEDCDAEGGKTAGEQDGASMEVSFSVCGSTLRESSKNV